LSTGYFASAEFISKDEAVEIFIKETGEDFRNILDYNPLPASFSLKLKTGFAEEDSLKKILYTLSGINFADEVVHKDDLTHQLLLYLRDFRIYILALTLMILIVSLYLVYSTVKLIINSRSEEFETMKLVGAKLSTIKL